MNGAGNEFLSSARFTCDQNCGVGWRNFGYAGQRRCQSRGCSHDFLNHRRTIDLFTQRKTLSVGVLLRLLLVVNIDASAAPANDPSLFVPQGIHMLEKPTI